MPYDFFKESIKNIKTTGTIARSSKFLAKQMVKSANLSDAKVIVELGAGDGAITKYILEKMAPDAKLYSFELNELFCQRLREVNDDRLVVLQEDVAKMQEILAGFDQSGANCIISAIPFTMFPEKDTVHILSQAKGLLDKTGKFVQVHYSLVMRKIYKQVFGNLDLNFVAINVPPAWVYVCEK
jgi:phospholipid N-methyltransferase